MTGDTPPNQSKDSSDLLLRQFVDQMMKLFTLRAHRMSLGVRVKDHPESGEPGPRQASSVVRPTGQVTPVPPMPQ